jgi:Protein of unknown function (DUF2934)
MATKKQSVSRPTQRATRNPIESRSNGNTSTHQPDEQSQDGYMHISKRAYALFEERGRNDGHALEDWLEAEQQVLNHSL